MNELPNDAEIMEAMYAIASGQEFEGQWDIFKDATYTQIYKAIQALPTIEVANFVHRLLERAYIK
jgi:hypothetical protein